MPLGTIVGSLDVLGMSAGSFVFVVHFALPDLTLQLFGMFLVGDGRGRGSRGLPMHLFFWFPHCCFIQTLLLSAGVFTALQVFGNLLIRAWVAWILRSISGGEYMLHVLAGRSVFDF